MVSFCAETNYSKDFIYLSDIGIQLPNTPVHKQKDSQKIKKEESEIILMKPDIISTEIYGPDTSFEDANRTAEEKFIDLKERLFLKAIILIDNNSSLEQIASAIEEKKLKKHLTCDDINEFILCAIRNERGDVIQLLVTLLGANINFKFEFSVEFERFFLDQNGKMLRQKSSIVHQNFTPLMYAAINNKPEAFIKLVQLGANQQDRTNHGHTAYDFAYYYNYQNILQFYKKN